MGEADATKQAEAEAEQAAAAREDATKQAEADAEQAAAAREDGSSPEIEDDVEVLKTMLMQAEHAAYRARQDVAREKANKYRNRQHAEWGRRAQAFQHSHIHQHANSPLHHKQPPFPHRSRFNRPVSSSILW